MTKMISTQSKLADSLGIRLGSQIILPDGFLSESFKHIREKGGICISDEIQVGLGRVGSTYWGFELQNVIPDIITIGKPLGIHDKPLGIQD